VHAFKIGEGSTHLDEAYGHELSLDVYRYAPELVGSCRRRLDSSKSR
jgi:hypothetical protein